MSRYRSKPVEIEAFQWDILWPNWFDVEINARRVVYAKEGLAGLGRHVMINTPSGWVRAVPGDWIIREPSGIGCYPCKDEVFRLKYEPFDPMADPL